MTLLKNWTEQNSKDYHKQIMIVQHGLNETGLFTDEALAKLLDNHPSHLIDFQHIPDDPDYPDQQVTVDFTGADGATMIKAAKSNERIWINVRQVMNTQPEYMKVLDQLHAELAEKTGQNMDRRNCRGGVLISSKTARTPYHADPTMTHLWHIRGDKRALVYPKTQAFLPDEGFESIILGEVDEDLPYEESFDKKALADVVLTGGEMVSWPHRSPHRVENLTYCVSMVMEYSTKRSAFTNAGMFANGMLRRRYGRSPSWAEASRPEKLAKAVVGRALKTAGMRKSFRRTDMVRFKLDPTSKGYVVPVDVPYERVH